MVVLAQFSDVFFTFRNLSSITKFGVVIGLLALGQTVVIIGGGGGIDLSVGAMLGLSGVSMGMAVNAGLNVWAGAFVGILTGGTLGVINASLISFLRIPPLLATLGTLHSAPSRDC
jgi:ribose/xylose/arabinose/galactoside ABC-type transport system permease subunit